MRHFIENRQNMPKHSARGVCFDNYHKPPQERRILLVFERPKNGSDGPEPNPRWRLPGGKCCNSLQAENCCLERDSDTAAREIMEETGLVVWLVRFLFKNVDRERPGGTTSRAAHTRKYFLMQTIGGRLKTRVRYGIRTPAWFPVAALPQNISPFHREIIARVLEKEEDRWQPHSHQDTSTQINPA